MLSFEKSPAGYYIVTTEEGHKYAWGHIREEKFQRLTSDKYKVEIIHNYYNMAMISVTNIATGKDALRQEINPLSRVGEREWVVDDQIDTFPADDSDIITGANAFYDSDDDPMNIEAD